MTYETVNVERSEGSAVIELNRPERLNAWSLQLGLDLRAAIEEIAAEDSIRAVLITGAGRGFSSGADLTDGRSSEDEHNADGNFDLSARLRRRYHPIILGIRRMPKPVVAAVNGPAAGIGCSLAMACDLVLAGESAKFILAFVNIGLVPDGGSSAFIPARVGLARATEMMMLGEKVDASTALGWGLVNRVVPDDQLRSEADALVARLAAGPTGSFAGIKELLNRRVYSGLEEQLEAEADAQQRLGRSDDFAEGVTAFMEKRPANFQGR